MAKYLEDIRVLGGTVSIGSLTSSNTDNLFEVNGDSAVYGTFSTTGLKITSGASSGYILQSDASGNATWVLPTDNAGVTGSGTTNYIPRWTATDTLSSTGSIYDDGSHVGIGTNTPTATLDVKSLGSTSSDNAFRVLSTTGDTSLFRVRGDGAVFVESPSIPSAELLQRWKITDSESYVQIQNSTGQDGLFVPGIYGIQDSGSTYVSLTSVGQIGVDTGSTPAMTWQVRNSSQVAIGTRPLYRWSNYTTPVMQIEANGNLGVGATGATYRLEVTGTVSTTGFRMTNGASSGYILQSDASGNATWVLPTDNAGVTGSGTTNYIPRWTATDTLSSTGSIYDDGSNVGINTSSLLTGAKVHIINSDTDNTTYGTYISVNGSNPNKRGYSVNLSNTTNDAKGLDVVFSGNTGKVVGVNISNTSTLTVSDADIGYQYYSNVSNSTNNYGGYYRISATSSSNTSMFLQIQGGSGVQQSVSSQISGSTYTTNYGWRHTDSSTANTKYGFNVQTFGNGLSNTNYGGYISVYGANTTNYGYYSSVTGNFGNNKYGFYSDVTGSNGSSTVNYGAWNQGNNGVRNVGMYALAGSGSLGISGDVAIAARVSSILTSSQSNTYVAYLINSDDRSGAQAHGVWVNNSSNSSTKYGYYATVQGNGSSTTNYGQNMTISGANSTNIGSAIYVTGTYSSGVKTGIDLTVDGASPGTNYGIQVRVKDALTGNYALRVFEGDVVFNDDGLDYDFRIEGLTQSNLFFVDADNDAVGIATNTPGADFEVNGFSKFGSDAPAIKTKLVTLTTPASGNSAASSAHFITGTIIGYDIVIEAVDNKLVKPYNIQGFNLSDYDANVSTTSCLYSGDWTTNSNVANSPLRFYITYIE